MNYVPYYNLCRSILRQKITKPTRQIDSIGTYIEPYGAKLVFRNIGKSEPILSKRFINAKKAFAEFKWIFTGSKDHNILKLNNTNWWDPWLPNIGPIYGRQLKNFCGVDQLDMFYKNLVKYPFSRRLILTMWNPSNLHEQVLPSCPVLLQFKYFTDTNKNINAVLHVYQRSADVFIGLPYDILVYQFFLMSLKKYITYDIGHLIFHIADAHIYREHIEAVKDMLKQSSFLGCKLTFARYKEIEKLDVQKDIEIKNYRFAKKINAKVFI